MSIGPGDKTSPRYRDRERRAHLASAAIIMSRRPELMSPRDVLRRQEARKYAGIADGVDTDAVDQPCGAAAQPPQSKDGGRAQLTDTGHWFAGRPSRECLSAQGTHG